MGSLDYKLGLELLITFIIGLRIYLLQRMEVSSFGEKIYAFYWLHKRRSLLGYLALFYSLLIFLILIMALPWNWFFIFIFGGDFLIWRVVFSGEEFNSYDQFLEWYAEKFGDGSREVKEMLSKPRPVWLLYGDELLLFLIATFLIQWGGD
jgi:hypothetical protein